MLESSNNHVSDRILLEFLIKSGDSNNLAETKVVPILSKHWKTRFARVASFGGQELRTSIFKSENEQALLTLRLHSKMDGNTLMTIDIDTPVADFGPSNQGSLNCLVEDVKEALAQENLRPNWQFLPIIKLGHDHNRYLTTSDDRIVEYAFQEVLYEAKSPFQHIQIVDTLDHGRMLILDGLVNLAEADTVSYTHQLMGLPKENYTRAHVLILGGGDGALLKELLELPDPPAFVTLIDIDPMVMSACTKYMPKACGKYLAEKEGDNFKVIVGDAFEHMKRLKDSGQDFDFIFGDLTDTPVDASGDALDDVSETSDTSHAWHFLRRVLELSLGLLKPRTGKYLTHCNGKSAPQALKGYEDLVHRVAGPAMMDFRKTEAFVSSFMEVWVFYQLFFKS